ncbi:hypothetical protein Taro_046834 [Colocasia esculenta]|uniref:Uncharacterized protein n=1 Tax=Colocasia esculenta TaxID=4460 RepID=A0A843X613_COLES|nr:hypothetical protein [Colocasia esculenta]
MLPLNTLCLVTGCSKVEQDFITDSRVQEISYGPSKIVHRSDARELAPSTQFSVDDINEPICLYKDNEEEEVDPNALDDHVVEREVESDEEEEWTDDEDEEDDEDDAELDISSASDDEYR